jgi:glycosyltransferase involved in cell wall biosynthesis
MGWEARVQPLRAGQLIKCLCLGGTERQLVELLGGLDREAVEPRLACLGKHGELLPAVRAFGIDPPEFPLRGTLLRPNTAMQALRLARWISGERVSILHCHDYYSNVLGSCASWIAGVPWIVSRRDLGAWGGPAHRRLLAVVTRAAPAVLCNSRAIRDHIVRSEGVLPERVRVIPNGLDLQRFDRALASPLVSPVPGWRLDRPVVTLVANLNLAVKGHDDFLLAAAAVHRTLPAVQYLLVGEGERRTAIAARARELGLHDVLFFAGYRTDVPALLARSTIAVSSSRSEGLSNAIMEAMAAALPVVATAVGGSAELVLDARTGFLVPSGDPASLAARLLTLLRAPDLAAELGRAGRRRIEGEFSSRRLRDRVTELYREMIEGSRTATARHRGTLVGSDIRSVPAKRCA